MRVWEKWISKGDKVRVSSPFACETVRGNELRWTRAIVIRILLFRVPGTLFWGPDKILRFLGQMFPSLARLLSWQTLVWTKGQEVGLLYTSLSWGPFL